MPLSLPRKSLPCVAIQRVDHLAVRTGGEVIRAGRAQFAVVVDLAVHRQRQCTVTRTQRLRAAGRIDDGQALVHQDHPGVHEHPAPVRPAMALALRQLQRQPAQRDQVVARLQVEHSKDRTHLISPLRASLVARVEKQASVPALFTTARYFRPCAQNDEGPLWAGLRRAFNENLLLRAGPPTVGVIVRAIIVVAGQHDAQRRKRDWGQKVGCDGMHVPT